MKRVLYLATCDFNKTGGGSQAVRAYLDSVLDTYGSERVDVMLGSEYQLLEEYKNIRCIRIPKRKKIHSFWEIFLGIVERWTYPLKKYLKDNYIEYELIILNSSRSGIVIPYLKKLGLRIITIHHNDEIEYCMDNKNYCTFGGRCSTLINNAQKKAYLYSDANLFLTEQDKHKLEKLYGPNNKNNCVIGVYDYKSAEIIVPHKINWSFHIGISGTLSDYQTSFGLLDIKDNYLDIIKRILPEYKLIITGRNPSSEVKEFAKENHDHIVIVPNPEHIISVIEKCCIYLCPTNIGGGLKLRVMDGLKLGMPILVHRVSARGYDCFLGKPYFKVYDDRQSFEKGLCELLRYLSEDNSTIRSEISRAYYSYFGYIEGTKRFKEIVNSTYEDFSNHSNI